MHKICSVSRKFYFSPYREPCPGGKNSAPCKFGNHCFRDAGYFTGLGSDTTSSLFRETSWSFRNPSSCYHSLPHKKTPLLSEKLPILLQKNLFLINPTAPPPIHLYETLLLLEKLPVNCRKLCFNWRNLNNPAENLLFGEALNQPPAGNHAETSRLHSKNSAYVKETFAFTHRTKNNPPPSAHLLLSYVRRVGGSTGGWGSTLVGGGREGGGSPRDLYPRPGASY